MNAFVVACYPLALFIIYNIINWQYFQKPQKIKMRENSTPKLALSYLISHWSIRLSITYLVFKIVSHNFSHFFPSSFQENYFVRSFLCRIFSKKFLLSSTFFTFVYFYRTVFSVGSATPLSIWPIAPLFSPFVMTDSPPEKAF